MDVPFAVAGAFGAGGGSCGVGCGDDSPSPTNFAPEIGFFDEALLLLDSAAAGFDDVDPFRCVEIGSEREKTGAFRRS